MYWEFTDEFDKFESEKERFSGKEKKDGKTPIEFHLSMDLSQKQSGSIDHMKQFFSFFTAFSDK